MHFLITLKHKWRSAVGVMYKTTRHFIHIHRKNNKNSFQLIQDPTMRQFSKICAVYCFCETPLTMEYLSEQQQCRTQQASNHSHPACEHSNRPTISRLWENIIPINLHTKNNNPPGQVDLCEEIRRSSSPCAIVLLPG